MGVLLVGTRCSVGTHFGAITGLIAIGSVSVLISLVGITVGGVIWKKTGQIPGGLFLHVFTLCGSLGIIAMGIMCM